MNRVWIPERKRPKPEAELYVVDVKLQNGRIVRDVALDRQGFLVGIVVGGHDGVRETDFDFDDKQIEKIRLQSAWTSIRLVRRLKDRFGLL